MAFPNFCKDKVKVISDRGSYRARVRDVIAPVLQQPAPAGPPAADDGDLAELVPDAIDQLAAEEQQEHIEQEEEEVPEGAVTDDEDGDSSSSSSSTPFDSIRKQLRQDFLDQYGSNQVLHKFRCSQELAAYKQRTQRLLCRCSSCAQFTQHQPADEQRYTPQEVYLCTQQAMHSYQAPMMACCSCGQRQRLRPLHVGCFPGCASASGHRAGRDDVVPVWFSMDLLQHVDSSTYHKSDQSTYTYVQARQDGWLLSQQVSDLHERGDGSIALPVLPRSYQQQQLPLTADTLRRQLGAAVREYQYAMAQLVTLPEEIEGYPTGQQRPCAACTSGRCHLFYDMCFKLEWLKRKGFTISYQQPPSARRFVGNIRRSQLLEEIDGALQQQRQLVPVALAAAAAVPARLPDLSPAALVVEGSAGEAGAGPAPPDTGQPAQGPPPAAAAAAAAAHEELEAADSAAAATESQACESGACSEFKADRLLTPAPSKSMITGVGLTVCRHGHVWHAVNCTEGERHAYAIMSFWLVVMSGFMLQCWWYDINCRWLPSLLRWLQQQAPEVQAAAAGVWVPVPPWHLLAHLISCRVKHGHLHMRGVGAGCGDVCEMVNAKLAPHGKITRYMHGTNREARLEAVLLKYERELDAKLPAVLANMLRRTQRELMKVARELQEAHADLQQLAAQQLDAQQVDEAAVAARAQEYINDAQRHLFHPPAAADMGWQAQYARARLILDSVKHSAASADADGPLAAPLSLLFASSVVGGIRKSKKAVSEARSIVGKLGGRFFPEGAPELTHPVVQEGLQQLAAISISTGLEQLLALLTQARYAEWVVQALTGRPSAQRTALKRKHALWQRVSADHRQLLEWVQWARKLQQRQILGTFPPALQAQLQHLLDTPLPDLSGTSEGTSLVAGVGSAAAHAGLKVYLLTSKQQGLHEEVELVLQEKGELVSVLEKRLSLLRDALHPLQQEAGGGGLVGRALTQQLTFLLEVARTEATLDAARKVGGGMSQAEEDEALAATELMYAEHAVSGDG